MKFVSENETPTKGSKRRKVATSPPASVLGKETLPTADGKKHHSFPRSESSTQEYLPALANKHQSTLHENADLWDVDTVKARKAAVEVTTAFTSHVDLSCFKEAGVVESSEMVMLNIVRAVACVQSVQEKCLQNAALVAESRAEVSKLTRELEEAQSEVKLEKINQEIAERLVEQARQEKYIVELKSTGEKASLKRKIEELEMELQQQRDRFNAALLDSEVDGYYKCVKKAKEKGLRYKKLLLDPMYDPIKTQQQNSPVPPSAKNLKDLENVPGSTNGVPIGSKRCINSFQLSSTEKALFDPADPIFYRSMIEAFAKKNLEGQVGDMVNKKGDNGTLKPTSSSLNISKKYKQLKDCKTELVGMKKAAFISGYKKCAEFIGEATVYDPSKHSFKAFVASEVGRLGILVPSSGNNENK
ncbi:hypothetical protein POM88_016172 [Heracleum sosnowskyi]|uniref:Uncharacterized protein n=1 Tax=Heracleum sosnowskyi TaxID=360622 RepID=A0AAD8MWV3_9APIA|nr:hypothetical protein POM88_016172 [Heracleum sosnowskyi]